MSPTSTRGRPTAPQWVLMSTAVDLRLEVLQRVEAYYEFTENVESTEPSALAQWIDGDVNKMTPTLICEYAIDVLKLQSVKWISGSQLSKRTMVLSPFETSMESPDQGSIDTEKKSNVELIAPGDTNELKQDEDSHPNIEPVNPINTSTALEGNDGVIEGMMMVPSDDADLNKVITNVVDSYFVSQRQQDRQDMQSDIRNIMTEVMETLVEQKVKSTMEGIIDTEKPLIMDKISSSAHNIEMETNQSIKINAESHSKESIKNIHAKENIVIKNIAVRRDEVLEAINMEADQAIEDFKCVTEDSMRSIKSNEQIHNVKDSDNVMGAKKTHSRFSNVDINNLGIHEDTKPYHASPRKNRDPYANPRDQNGSSMSTYGFHKYFKAKLKNDNHILNFYQQLRQQGSAYGIHCVPMQDIYPNVDLCPAQYTQDQRNEMALTIYQKLQDEDCISVGYAKAQKLLQQYASVSDGYRVLQQLLRFVHPNLRHSTANTYDVPKLSASYGNLYDYGSKIINYILMQHIQHRTYTDTEKTVMFLNNMDDPKYNEAKNRALAEVRHITTSGITRLDPNLMLESLPTTLEQYHEQIHGAGTVTKQRYVRSIFGEDENSVYDDEDGSEPVVRAFMRRRDNQHSNQRNQYPRNSNFSNNGRRNFDNRRSGQQNSNKQCTACGRWGCDERKCQFVAKVQLAMNFIKQHSSAASKLAEEYLRTNHVKTRMSMIRTLKSSIAQDHQDTHVTDSELLDQYHLEIPMEEIDFESNEE